MSGLLVVRDNLVVNSVVADPTGQWQPPEGCITMEMPDDVSVGIGWRLIDGQWVAPPPPPEDLPLEDLDSDLL